MILKSVSTEILSLASDPLVQGLYDVDSGFTN